MILSSIISIQDYYSQFSSVFLSLPFCFSFIDLFSRCYLKVVSVFDVLKCLDTEITLTVLLFPFVFYNVHKIGQPISIIFFNTFSCCCCMQVLRKLYNCFNGMWNGNNRLCIIFLPDCVPNGNLFQPIISFFPLTFMVFLPISFTIACVEVIVISDQGRGGK